MGNIRPFLRAILLGRYRPLWMKNKELQQEAECEEEERLAEKCDQLKCALIVAAMLILVWFLIMIFH